jgi:lipopolysaccharide export system protein LptA
MVTWQRRARLVTVAVGLTVSVVVFVSTHRREPPPAPPTLSRVDPEAVVESSGAMVRDVKGEHERFRVQADRQLSYSNGTTKLVGVRVTVERNGKTFVLTGDEARVGDKQSSVQLDGHVHLQGSDGLKLDAASATYTESDGIVRAPGLVTFARGSMSGQGVDFTYDRGRDMIGLSEQSSIKVLPDAKDTAGADITAGSALLARKDGFMTFQRNVHIVRGTQVIDADRTIADLTPDEKHITALDMTGNALVRKSDAVAGGLRVMSATNIHLTYADNSERLERAVIVEKASVTIAGAKGYPDKTLGAETIEMAVGSDGMTLTSLVARDKVVLDLPGTKGEPSKNIRSNTLTGSGDDQHGLTAAVFSDSVEYRESGGTPSVQRLVHAQHLETALTNGLDEIRNAVFTGAVQFNDGSTRASAASVRYEVATGHVDLTGKIGNAVPRVTTEQIVVDADHIEMTLDGPIMKATPAVKAVMQPPKQGSGAAAAKMPGLMEQDRPVNASSNELNYRGGRQSKADFSGSAVLWQGDTRVQGTSITVEGETGNLAANGAVLAKFPVETTNADTKKKEASLAEGRGHDMLYDDAKRRATFKTEARLKGPDGDITASEIHVTLASETNEVERLEAAGALTLAETNRVTTGDKLLYVAANDETYTVTGKPAQMAQTLDNGCRINRGTTLMFSKATDKLRIDGNEETRTQTKTEGRCAPAAVVPSPAAAPSAAPPPASTPAVVSPR